LVELEVQAHHCVAHHITMPTANVTTYYNSIPTLKMMLFKCLYDV